MQTREPTIERLSNSASATEDDAAAWRSDEAREKAKAEGRIARARARDLENLVDQRERFAKYFLLMAVGWLIFVGVAIVLDSAPSSPYNLDLTENTVLALLGTATVNVLAPAYLVAKYLFGNPR